MVSLLNSTKAKAAVPRDWGYAPITVPDSRMKHVTMIFCISADGGHLPSCAILPDLKYLPSDLDAVVDSLAWSSSDSGWITDEIYEQWVENVFIPFVNAKRSILDVASAPAVLWLDGHGSRASPKARAALLAHNVFVIVIPAHTSHILAPLDCGVNRSFKTYLSTYYEQPETTGAQDVRCALLQAAVRASYHCLDPHTVASSFKAAGVWPWDPQTISGDASKVSDAPKKVVVRQSSRMISGRVLVSPGLVTAQFINSLPPTTGSEQTP